MFNNYIFHSKLTKFLLLALAGFFSLQAGPAEDLKNKKSVFLYPGTESVFKSAGLPLLKDVQQDLIENKYIAPISIKSMDTIKNMNLNSTDKEKDFLIVAGSHGDMDCLFDIDLKKPKLLNTIMNLIASGVKFKYIIVEACTTGYMMGAFKALLADDGLLIGTIPSTGSVSITDYIVKNYKAELTKQEKKDLFLKAIALKAKDITVGEIAGCLTGCSDLSKVTNAVNDYLNCKNVQNDERPLPVKYFEICFSYSHFFKNYDELKSKFLGDFIQNLSESKKKEYNFSEYYVMNNALVKISPKGLGEMFGQEFVVIKDFFEKNKNFWNEKYDFGQIQTLFDKEIAYLVNSSFFKNKYTQKCLLKKDFEKIVYSDVTILQVLNGCLFTKTKNTLNEKQKDIAEGLGFLKEFVLQPLQDIESSFSGNNVVSATKICNKLKEIASNIQQVFVSQWFNGNTNKFTSSQKTSIKNYIDQSLVALEKEILFIQKKYANKSLSKQDWLSIKNHDISLYNVFCEKCFFNGTSLKNNQPTQLFEKYPACGLIVYSKQNDNFYFEKWIQQGLGMIFASFSMSDVKSENYIVGNELKEIINLYSKENVSSNQFIPVVSLPGKLKELLEIDKMEIDEN